MRTDVKALTLSGMGCAAGIMGVGVLRAHAGAVNRLRRSAAVEHCWHHRGSSACQVPPGEAGSGGGGLGARRCGRSTTAEAHGRFARAAAVESGSGVLQRTARSLAASETCRSVLQRTFFPMARRAKYTDMKALVLLVAANGAAAGYSLLQAGRCAVAMARGGGTLVLSRALAWAVFSGDQLLAYVMLAATVGHQLGPSLEPMTG